MGLEYASYLGLVLFGALLARKFFRVKFEFAESLLAILPVAVLFILWDIFAVWRGHWSFGLGKMLGVVVLNQPVEEIAFFFVIPYMYLTVWGILKGRKWNIPLLQ